VAGRCDSPHRIPQKLRDDRRLQGHAVGSGFGAVAQQALEEGLHGRAPTYEVESLQVIGVREAAFDFRWGDNHLDGCGRGESR